MKLHEAYAKMNAHFSEKGIEAGAVTDDQWNSAVKELGLETVFQNKASSNTGSRQPVPPAQNGSLDAEALGAIVAGVVNDAVKPMQEKIDKLENARQDSEKEREAQAKTKLQSDKQELVDKLYKEKKISKEQKEAKYKELIENENFSLDNLTVIAESLPVNDAFADPEGSEEDGDDAKKTEIKTGKFNPEEDWGKQKRSLHEEAMNELESQLSK